MVQQDDEVQFIDAEQYSGRVDEKLTFRMIVLEHLRRMGKLSSVEFRGGGYEVREIVSPGYTNYVKTWIADTREEYSNAVDYLSDILCPYYDDEMRKADEELEAEREKLYDDCNQDPKNFDKQNYRDEKRYIKRKLFRALNRFLFRAKYLEIKSFEEEA